MNPVPSSIRIACRPLTWYCKRGASQLPVPAIGFPSSGQRQPGSEPVYPAAFAVEPDLAAAGIEDLGVARGNSRVSPAAWKLRCPVFCIGASAPSPGSDEIA